MFSSEASCCGVEPRWGAHGTSGGGLGLNPEAGPEGSTGAASEKGWVRRLTRCMQWLGDEREHEIFRELCWLGQGWGGRPPGMPWPREASKARLKGARASSCGQWSHRRAWKNVYQRSGCPCGLWEPAEHCCLPAGLCPRPCLPAHVPGSSSWPRVRPPFLSLAASCVDPWSCCRAKHSVRTSVSVSGPACS